MTYPPPWHILPPNYGFTSDPQLTTHYYDHLPSWIMRGMAGRHGGNLGPPSEIVRNSLLFSVPAFLSLGDCDAYKGEIPLA